MTHTSDAIADTENLPVIASPPRPDGLVGFEVIGDSMMPTLKPGDFIVVDTLDKDIRGESLFVIDDGNGPMVRRLRPLPKSCPPEVTLIADNRNHTRYAMPREDVLIIGRVAGRLTRM